MVIASGEKVEAGKRGRVLYLELVDAVPVSEALRLVAAQYDDVLPVIRRGRNVYFVGRVGDSDLISRVYYCSDLKADEVSSLVSMAGSPACKVAVSNDVVVVRDTVEGLRSIDRLWGSLQGGRGQYAVEVRVVELTKRGADRLGIDWGLAGAVRVNVSAEFLRPAVSVDVSAVGQSELLGFLAAEEEDSGVHLVTMGRLSVLEGREASLMVGETTPVPQRTVSDQGTVSVSGYSEVESGFQLSIQVRTEPGGRLRVYANPSVSAVSGYVGDEAPIVATRKVVASAVMQSGGCLVLGGFSQRSDARTKKGLPAVQWLRSLQQESKRIFFVLRVLEVGKDG